MSDNVAITPGSGENISAEEVTTLNGSSVSAVKVQRTGIALITANSTAVDLPGDATNGLLVNLGSNNNVTVTGTVTAQDGGGSLTVDNAALSVVGGGAEATALRVTLASDSTGVVSVDDNGSSLTVDGTVALGAGSASIGTLGANSGVDIGDVTINNASGASAVNIQDGGNSITVDGTVSVSGTVTVSSHAVTNAGTFATQVDGAALTALQLIDDVVVTEDAAHSTGDKGVMALAVRRDANTTLADTTGDYAPLQVDASGSLKVAITAGAGSGGTSLADDAAFTPASTSFTPVGGIVTSDSVDSGDGGAFAMLANRQQKVTLYDSSGVEQAVGGGTQYTEDAAAAANPIGNALNLVRDDARAGSLTTTDGDNVAARGTNAGELYVKHVDSIPVTDNSGTLTVDAPVGTPVFVRLSDGADPIATLPVSLASVPSHAVTNAGTFAVQVSSLPASTNTIEVVGDAAHDAAVAGNPVLVGAEFDDAAPDSVDEGDVGRLRISANRNLYATLRDAAGNERGANVNASNQLSVSVDNTVTVAAHAVTNAGTFVVQENGAALTALQLLDDAVKTDDAAFTPGTDKVLMIGAQLDATGPDVVDEGDAGALRMTADRALHSSIRDAAGNNRGANVDASNRLTVSVDNTVTVGSHAVTNAGTFAVQVDGAALTALQLLDDTVIADDAAFTVGTTKVSCAGFFVDESSTDSADEGDAGAARMTPDRRVIVVPQPHTGGGLSIFRSLDLDETEEEVKSTAGSLYSAWVCNLATSTRFLKIYNATAANVTVGTTTPVITIPIPGNASDDISAVLTAGGYGISFDTAITVAATTGIADNDTGAPGANEVVVNIFYR
jgi:hypothetical protein